PGKFISRYSPSLMSDEALEATFIQRHKLIKRIVGLVCDDVETGSRHFSLLIGPRGVGKTHFIALLHSRLLQKEELQENLLIAWLREEEWGVTTFLDFLLRVIRSLKPESQDPSFPEKLEAIYDHSVERAEEILGDLLHEYVGDRLLLVLTENMDDLFNGLKNEGQSKLRAYLQERNFISIVGTSPSLFHGISRQVSPFYGTFRIHHLEKLTIDEAEEMLIKIADYREDTELSDFIKTPSGRARVRAIHHLAGANHRIYSILSQFLNRESLDQLVDAFMSTLDDLTPYYQSRMTSLPQQPRKIVELLCDLRGAIPVKRIAQRCFLKHQTVSSQLKILKEKGYVRSETLGRESYYELQEPLMRLCVEVKKNRAEPIRLLVDFLRIWYSLDDLKLSLTTLNKDSWLEREYIQRALKTDETENKINYKSLFIYSVALILNGKKELGIEKLSLSLSNGELTDSVIITYTTVLLSHGAGLPSCNKNDWLMWMNSLLKEYKKSNKLRLLGAGLMGGIFTWLGPNFDVGTLKSWLNIWHKAASHLLELRMPLRFLEALIQFDETKDSKILLEFPSEERGILNEMINKSRDINCELDYIDIIQSPSFLKLL
ncbi:MAG: hypothetical protein COB67_13595, partial [SAR324 cluster bacterium]